MVIPPWKISEEPAVLLNQPLELTVTAPINVLVPDVLEVINLAVLPLPLPIVVAPVTVTDAATIVKVVPSPIFSAPLMFVVLLPIETAVLVPVVVRLLNVTAEAILCGAPPLKVTVPPLCKKVPVEVKVPATLIFPEDEVRLPPDITVKLLNEGATLPAIEELPAKEIVPVDAVKAPLVVSAPTMEVVFVPAVKVTPAPAIVNPALKLTAALPVLLQFELAPKVTNPLKFLVPDELPIDIVPEVPVPRLVTPATEKVPPLGKANVVPSPTVKEPAMAQVTFPILVVPVPEVARLLKFILLPRKTPVPVKVTVPEPGINEVLFAVKVLPAILIFAEGAFKVLKPPIVKL